MEKRAFFSSFYLWSLVEPGIWEGVRHQCGRFPWASLPGCCPERFWAKPRAPRRLLRRVWGHLRSCRTRSECCWTDLPLRVWWIGRWILARKQESPTALGGRTAHLSVRRCLSSEEASTGTQLWGLPQKIAEKNVHKRILIPDFLKRGLLFAQGKENNSFFYFHW